MILSAKYHSIPIQETKVHKSTTLCDEYEGNTNCRCISSVVFYSNIYRLWIPSYVSFVPRIHTARNEVFCMHPGSQDRGFNNNFTI